MPGSDGMAASESARAARRRLIGSVVVVAALCGVIFAIDTLLPFDMAIAVLYLVVVVFAASVFERLGLLIVGAVCVGLTGLSFVIIHADDYNLSSVMRCLVSLAAIAVTTLLTLRNQRDTRALRGQADLLDLSHDAIFVRGPSDIITYWNRGAERLYGWTRAEALGSRAGALLRSELPPCAEPELMSSGLWEGELTHTAKDGRRVITISRWSRHRDARGRLAGTLETDRDITDRKMTEEKLHEARGELAHVTRLSTMGELTASITHEVNQPLAAVVTNGEACLRWLRRDQPDIGEATTSVERMIANARRASDVVARLRALARREEPEHLPLDPREWVDECLLLLERELSSHRIRLELELAGHGLRVAGDRVQLQQVLINLMINAIQALDEMPEDRRVLRLSLTARQTDDASPAAQMIVLEVEDSGPGAAPQALPNLFTAFYSTKKEGIGIGLSISRSIVEAHGGHITAASAQSGGLRFTVALPLQKETVS
ncbi:MAG: ATP-binding protein [Pseudomonadota bacterium]